MSKRPPIQWVNLFKYNGTYTISSTWRTRDLARQDAAEENKLIRKHRVKGSKVKARVVTRKYTSTGA
jgi:hypothetical protein